MCAKSSTGRTQPSRREISTTSSAEPSSRTRPITSIPNGTARSFASSRSRSSPSCSHDRVDRLLARAAEQEARVEDDDLGARRLGDPGRVVEHPDRHVQLLAALGVAHEPGDRRVHREDDAVLARQLAEARRRSRSPSRSGPRSRSRRPSSRARAAPRPPPRGSPARAPAQGRSAAVRAICTESLVRRPSDPLSTLLPCPRRPSRIDLLELDIDLRLADLWREAAGIERMVARGRRRLHAGRLRQGLLRRADRGAPGLALRRPRLPRPGSGAHPTPA